MKKYFVRLLVVFLTAFIFVSGVDAALDCSLDGKEVIIKKAGIKSEGFDVKVPYCKYGNEPTGFSPIGKWYDTYQKAYDSGLDTELRLYEDADAKGTHLSSVTVCSSNLRKVSGKYTCSVSKRAVSERHSSTCSSKTAKDTCTNAGCNWNDDEGECWGDNSYTSYKCPDGYDYSGNITSSTLCTKSWEKTIETIGNDANALDAKDACQADSANAGGSCDCSVQYQLVCPVYKCDLSYKTVSACNQTFTVDGDPAYCVNPSQGFNVSVDGKANYQEDDTFDVDNCASSYSTVDCGYANILIEGAYYNKPKEGHTIPDSAINTALRLWGVHSGQAGFDKTGIANVVGENCNSPMYYMQVDGKYANVYKLTHDYIMAHFYSIAVKYTHIPDNETYMTGYDGTNEKGRTFEKIACDRTNTKTLLGVMCGENVSYRIAFELYFNTLIGNKYMKEHLLALTGGESGAKPTGATIKTSTELTENTKEKTWVEVTFENEYFWEKLKDEEVDCTKLDSMVAKGEITAEIRDQIKPFCKVRVEIYDSGGQPILTDLEIQKCYKGSGCTTKEFEFAICDIVKERGKEIEIRVTYKKTESNYTIRKYQSCSNANANQVMFAYIDLSDKDGKSGGTSKVEEIGREEITKQFAVTNFKCNGGGCDDAKTRSSELKSSCSSDKNDYTYGKVYTSTVKDPSLSCIVDLKNPEQKTAFDYSKYFGVNTNFCRVYCSDEVTYKLPDKVHAVSGRTFSYDIEFAAYGTKNSSRLLSSVVEVKRTCTSEIYYDQLPLSVDWKTTYGLTNEENDTLKKNPTFATLYNVLKAKAAKENNRTENLNQILYDLYNCNFYADKVIKNNGVNQPRENTVGNVRNKISTIYSKSNSYGLSTGANGETQLKEELISGKVFVRYGFAAINDATGSTISPVSNTGTLDGSLSAFTYCSDKNGSLCFSYPGAAHDKESYNYNAGSTSSTEANYTFNGKNIKVPTNDYAMFSVNTRINYFNGNKYQAKEGSGRVVKGGTDTALITLDNQSYPIDKNAYNSADCNKDGISVNNPNKPNDKRCVVQTSIVPTLFYRATSRDSLSTLLSNNTTYTCYVDVEMPEPVQSTTVYRNVDPTNLFPATDGAPKAGSNWDTEEGRKAAVEIQNSASEIATSDKLLEYKISLTPTQIKSIKSYNSRNGAYSNEIIYNCTKVNETYYINCKSNFLDMLRGSDAQYSSGTFGTLDSKYNGL